MTPGPAAAIWCASTLLAEGWAEAVRLDLDAAGTIVGVHRDAAPDGCESIDGVVVPGIPNLHCHAFQRAMAGLAERAGADANNFWSWRDTMYRLVDRLTPEQIEAIAAQLYVELLKAGYTAVAEFHYLHNAPDGTPYADRAELARRIVAAAEAAGIRLTLLPVLYRASGFGGAPPGEAQRRFALAVDDWLDLVAALEAENGGDLRVAGALHSLRAVPEDDLAAAVAGYFEARESAPLHIHIAEQEKEVADCVAWSGARPVDWLLDHCPVDARWVLVHATHMTGQEAQRAAAAGAIVGLCPTTEANLGDGLFDLPTWLAAGGGIGIGSDSNVSVDPCEELRWLEYGQRLISRRRTVSADGPGESTGARLWRKSLDGGARALGQPVGGLAVGAAADLIGLDPDHPALFGRSADQLVDALVFAPAGSPIRDVWVGGQRVIESGRHRNEERVAERFRDAVRALAAAA